MTTICDQCAARTAACIQPEGTLVVKCPSFVSVRREGDTALNSAKPPSPSRKTKQVSDKLRASPVDALQGH
jgi:hypothetical protein